MFNQKAINFFFLRARIALLGPWYKYTSFIFSFRVFYLLCWFDAFSRALSGIIRAIDPASHLFYVLTPVLPERLAAVTCIVRGALELPSVFMQAQDPRDDSTDVSAALPYVSVAGSGNFSFSKSDAAVGASFMKSRDNLQRKRYR